MQDNISLTNETISKENCPMALVWYFKPAIIATTILVAVTLFGYISYELVAVVIGSFFYNKIIGKKFEYSFSDNSFRIASGVFNKKEVNKNYQEISSVSLKSDWFDSFFGISQLIINFNKDSSGSVIDPQKEKSGAWAFLTKTRGVGVNKNLEDQAGSEGGIVVGKNNIVIPGLNLSDAVKIKKFIEGKKNINNEQSAIENSKSGIIIDLKEEEKAGFSNFSILSIILLFISFAVVMTNSFSAIFILVLGIIFGILGRKTERKKMATTGVVLNSLVLVVFIVIAGLTFFMYVKKINPFTGEPLTEEDMIELGIE